MSFLPLSRLRLAGLAALCAASPLAAQSLPPDSILVRALSFRSIGPVVMSGRIAAIAATNDPSAPHSPVGSVLYAGGATAGVWKSTNGGATWTPISDSLGIGSIGAVSVAPSNPNVVWVGTGESNNMRSSSWGNGVYKSLDGGRTWSKAMLPTSQHIGRIVIDPRDPNVVYVAAVGPLWASGGERGLYKTTDGGKTWTNTKEISRYTGFGDVAMDPSNPDVLYAAAEERERREYGFLPAGTEAALYKTTDGAKTWTKLAGGLPNGEIGRVGLSICKSRPSTVYANISASGNGNGVYRSDDAGATWRLVNSVNGTAWYYSQIFCDPTDPDHVITLNANSRESRDGGKTFTPFASGNGIHTDHHALWINDENPSQMLLGSDGGLYATWDAGKTWDHVENLVAGQFYSIAVDDAQPFYNVYGGLQDNETWLGPSRTRNAYGPTNGDWSRMAGGDGFYAVPDATDHQIVYAESQQGGIVRYDARTGQTKNIKPVPTGGDRYRYNWSTPIVPSVHTPKKVYMAANYLFRSPDRGDTWEKISPDLTRNIDRNTLPLRGAVPPANALGRNEGTAEFSNISTVDESPMRAGLIAVGTDDGVIQVTRDDGKAWTKADHFPGVPDTTYVSRVEWSNSNEGTLYASFDGHRSNDFDAYVYKSTDFGKTWTSITGNLPNGGATQVVREHPRNANLLFAGTEFGVFFTPDGGSHWTQLKNGLPGVPVWDLQIQPRANDLVLGTHGRAIYIMDDIGPLEHLAQARAAQTAYLVPVHDALLFQPNNSLNSGMGTRGFTGENPPPGPAITYVVNPPANAKVSLSILDAAGKIVRELPANRQAGMHRLTWDMRVGAPLTGPVDTTALQAQLAEGGRAGRGARGAGGGGGRGGAPGGETTFPATPGRYTARLTVTPAQGAATVLTQSFALTKDPMVTLSDAELKDLYTFRLNVASLQRTLRGEQAKYDSTQRTFAAVKRAADSAGTKVSPELKSRIAALEKDLADVTRQLGSANAGGRGGRGGGRATPPVDTASNAPPAGRGAGRGGAGGGRAGGRGGRGGRGGAAGNAGASGQNANAGAAATPPVNPPVEEEQDNQAPPENAQSRLGTTTEMLNTTFNPSPAQKKVVATLPADLAKQDARLKQIANTELPAIIKALKDAGVDVKTQ